MRTKSVPVRSGRKSLYPNPSLPGRFGAGEIDCDDDESDVPHKRKRHCRLETGDETDGGRSETLKLDACIVCEISDYRVSRCCGIDCLVHFHEKCLTPEFGGNEDLANPFCPYCWLKIVSLKSKSLRDEVIAAEKAVVEYLDKEMDDVKKSVPVNQEHSVKSRDIASDDHHGLQEEDEGKLQVVTGIKEHKLIDGEEVETSEDEEERVATENFQDDEDEDEDETAQVQTGAGRKRDVSLYSGKEQEQVQVQLNDEKQRRRRRRVELNDAGSEISSTEERNGENVTEQMTSSPSGEMKNQQRKLTAAAAKSKTVREVSSFIKDRKRRQLWTSEEEEMLKVGVEKFAAEANKNMPWRKILEMGENVFHQTRNPSDLKDKWRNMIKALR